MGKSIQYAIDYLEEQLKVCPQACALGPAIIDKTSQGAAAPRGSTYAWIRKMNTDKDRAERRSICLLTRLATDRHSYRIGEAGDNVTLASIPEMLKGTRLVSPTVGEWPMPIQGPDINTTGAATDVAGDTSDVAAEAAGDVADDVATRANASAAAAEVNVGVGASLGAYTPAYATPPEAVPPPVASTGALIQPNVPTLLTLPTAAAVANSVNASGAGVPLPHNPQWGSTVTSISLVQQTVLDAAVERARQANTRVVAVNAASAYQAGGGFHSGGRHALEESMCVQSTLFVSLERAQKLSRGKGVKAPCWVKPSKRKDGEPWKMHIPDDGAILSPSVEVFRQGTNAGYIFENSPTKLAAVVSIAMPNCNEGVRDAPVDAELDDELPVDVSFTPGIDKKDDLVYIAQLERKWRAALVAAAYYTDATCLVLPDAGCGVFENPPAVVGAAFGRVLAQEFSTRFAEVVVAVFGDKGVEFGRAAQDTFAKSLPA